MDREASATPPQWHGATVMLDDADLLPKCFLDEARSLTCTAGELHVVLRASGSTDDDPAVRIVTEVHRRAVVSRHINATLRDAGLDVAWSLEIAGDA